MTFANKDILLLTKLKFGILLIVIGVGTQTIKKLQSFISL